MSFKDLKEIDYITSSKWEKILKKDIEKYFNINLLETTRYDAFDYINDDGTIHIELKTRTCKSNTYKDIMMGYNKILVADKYLKDNDNKIYFVFKFTDGLYYLEYQTKDDYTMRGGGRCDRGVNEWRSDFIYFPSKKLIKMY